MEDVPTEVPVLENEDLVREIVQRTGFTRSMIRCRAVSPRWLAALRSPFFVSRFADRSSPAHLGFLVEFQQGPGRVMKLVYSTPSDAGETADALRPRIDTTALARELILASRDGFILTVRPPYGGLPSMYYTTCPSHVARVYKPVASVLPRIPHVLGAPVPNIFGHFGLMPDAGPSGMGIFVKDPGARFIATYEGVTFCSSQPILLYVSVYKSGLWFKFVSQPLAPPYTALFQRNPYCVYQKPRLFMMYTVDCIFCFDTVETHFFKIDLPSALVGKIRSWYDYSVTHHKDGGLALVHYTTGKLNTWVLRIACHVPSWTLERTVSLIEAAGNRIAQWKWDQVISRDKFSLKGDDFFTVQIRAVSPEAKYVFITFGFDRGMFEVDMVASAVRELDDHHRVGLIGRFFNVSEEWPPKP